MMFRSDAIHTGEKHGVPGCTQQAHHSAGGDGAIAPQLWQRYWDQPSDQTRNALIEHYLPKVEHIARRVHARIGRVVQIEDLVAAGVLGLMSAIAGFDAGRRVRFDTFSAIRIRGAMLDELRSMDWAPRLLRTRAKRVDAATRALRGELGRQPADQEVAGRLGLSDVDYMRLSRQVRLANIRPLDSNTDGRRHAEGAEDRETTIGALHGGIGREQDNPIERVQRLALRDSLTRSLSRSERLLVVLYYYEGLSMREVGRVLDLSESRVSQLRSAICARLREIGRPDTASELAA